MAGTISKAAAKRADREAAIERLREIFPAGSTAFTVLKHVSASGMTRHIDVIARIGEDVDNVSYLVARALDMSIAPRGGIKCVGVGMDMGFWLIYEMSQTIHVDSDRAGYAVKHRWL